MMASREPGLGDGLAALDALAHVVLAPDTPTLLRGRFEAGSPLYVHALEPEPAADAAAGLAASLRRLLVLLPASLEPVGELPPLLVRGVEARLVAVGSVSPSAEQLETLEACTAALHLPSRGSGAPWVRLCPAAADGADGGPEWREAHLVARRAADLNAKRPVLDGCRVDADGLRGAVLVAAHNNIKYVFQRVAEGTPQDTTFAVAAKAKDGSAEAAERTVTVLGYFAKRWGVALEPPGQPLLAAAHAAALASGRPAAGGGRAVLLPAQVCLAHPVPVALWPAAAAAPEMLAQLEGLLAAHDLRGTLAAAGVPPPPLGDLRAAITPPSAQDAGGAFESLELLGDAHLKLAVTADVFFSRPHLQQGELSMLRAARVSNVALAAAARRLGLQRFVQAPPISASRRGKIVADAFEALLGVLSSRNGRAAADCLLRHLGVLSTPEAEALKPPPPLPRAAPPPPAEEAAGLEALLGHRFSDASLLAEALTHGSFLGGGAGGASYERLEFLGDAVLDAAVTAALFDGLAGAAPGALHDARSAAVNAEHLALCAVRAGLDRRLRLASPPLRAAVDAFAAAARSAAAAAPGGWGGLLSGAAFGLDRHEAPKVLSDALEALVGAVFADGGGRDLAPAAAAARRLLGGRLAGLDGEPVPLNPTRRLHELAARRGARLELERVGPDGGGVRVRVVLGGEEVVAAGPPAPGLEAATRMAAQAALRVLDA